MAPTQGGVVRQRRQAHVEPGPPEFERKCPLGAAEQGEPRVVQLDPPGSLRHRPGQPLDPEHGLGGPGRQLGAQFGLI